jgi:WD40 repeat protein
MDASYRVRLGVVAALMVGDSLSAASPAESPRKLVLQGPPANSVNSVAVSPDGSLVATASGEGGVRLYDAQTGGIARCIGGAGDRCVVFSPDGRTLTAAGFHMDKLVGIYDVQTGKRSMALPGQTEWEADATAFSPDGKLIASTGTDKQILVWDLATGKLRHQLKDQSFRSAALAFSPDSATLASAGGDKLVRFWDMKTGQVRRSLTGHSDWICTIAFSPDGRLLASGSCDWGFHRGHDWVRPPGSSAEQCEWRLWEVASGKLLHTFNQPGRLLSLAFAPDGKSLACGVDKNVWLYDVLGEPAGKLIASHDATVTSVAFTPNATAIVSGSHDQTVKRTELGSGKVTWHAPGYFEQVNSVALSDDGTLVVTGSSDHRFARGRLQAGTRHFGPGAVRLWDARTGRLVRRLSEPAEQIMAAAISSDGRRIAGGGGVVGGNAVVRVWDAATGALTWSMNDHLKEVLALAFAPADGLLATASADGVVKIRDAATGKPRQVLEGHQGGATSLAFSGDGKTLFCAEGYGATRIWDAHTGTLLHKCPVGASAESLRGDRLINSIGLSADGSVLATCNSSINNEFVDRVRIWDARTGSLKRDFAAENIHGRPMALSPDGSIVATGGKSVKLWDVRTGKMLRELFGHLKRTQSIVFSRDGRLVVSGGSYGTVNVWETATGKHLVTLFAFSDSPNGKSDDDWVAYHPEGYYDCSPGGERYLGWRVGDEFHTPSTLGTNRHRPDRIESALRP